MKKTFTIFAAVLLMAGFSTTVMADNTATTNAGAILVVPMTITQTTPLHFGSIMLTTTIAENTVTLASATNDRSFSPGVSAGAASDPATNAAYNVTGTYNETYTLTLPIGDIALTETGGAGALDMTVNAFTATFTSAGTTTATTSVLSSAGGDSFTLGATLTIPSSQKGGVFTGSFPVTVNYN